MPLARNLDPCFEWFHSRTPPEGDDGPDGARPSDRPLLCICNALSQRRRADVTRRARVWLPLAPASGPSRVTGHLTAMVTPWASRPRRVPATSSWRAGTTTSGRSASCTSDGAGRRATIPNGTSSSARSRPSARRSGAGQPASARSSSRPSRGHGRGGACPPQTQVRPGTNVRTMARAPAAARLSGRPQGALSGKVQRSTWGPPTPPGCRQGQARRRSPNRPDRRSGPASGTV
jgi:hypothetical protein